MAKAWLEAASDLQIEVIHPYTFQDKEGVEHETSGAFLPHFGSNTGMLLVNRFDPESVQEACDNSDHRSSGLNPNSYEPYNRERYIQTLSDWGWYGEGAPPEWYDPDWREKIDWDK